MALQQAFLFPSSTSDRASQYLRPLENDLCQRFRFCPLSRLVENPCLSTPLLRVLRARRVSSQLFVDVSAGVPPRERGRLDRLKKEMIAALQVVRMSRKFMCVSRLYLRPPSKKEFDIVVFLRVECNGFSIGLNTIAWSRDRIAGQPVKNNFCFYETL